jgi:hypothetical protein
MIYLKTDYVTIDLNEDLKLLEIEWHGLILSSQYRETMEMVLDMLEEKNVENFLINRQHMQRISLADEKWRKEFWYPEFLKSSVKRSASVISRDYYNEVSVSQLIEENDPGIKVERRSFYNYQEARKWLLENSLVNSGST